MAIKKETNGRRSIQVEVEVPGTPEEVWRAIGTGAGISSWFVPTKLDERVGGEFVCTFAPGMDSRATVTAWQPPNYCAAESRDLGPKSPAMANEWFVEAKSGGTCIVRVVHSLFADTDDWDNQLTGTESGWPAYFAILKIVLTHYRDQRVHGLHETSFTSGSDEAAWSTMAAAFGVTAAAVGEKRTAPAGVPPVSGTVAHTKHNQIILHLEKPAPGVGMFYAMPCGGPVWAGISFYLFGEGAADVVTRDQPLWRAWLDAHFPAAAASDGAGSSATTAAGAT
jgi:uncharacterized protein YndB with AHSA1/START domain